MLGGCWVVAGWMLWILFSPYVQIASCFRGEVVVFGDKLRPVLSLIHVFLVIFRYSVDLF